MRGDSEGGGDDGARVEGEGGVSSRKRSMGEMERQSSGNLGGTSTADAAGGGEGGGGEGIANGSEKARGESGLGGTGGASVGAAAPRTREPEENVVRTLYITGWPVDLREREVHNLFRVHYSGYEGCNVKLNVGRHGEPVVFVQFERRAEAERAMRDMQGVPFDEEQNCYLRIEFARSNTRTKRARTDHGGLSMPQTQHDSRRSRGPARSHYEMERAYGAGGGGGAYDVDAVQQQPPLGAVPPTALGAFPDGGGEYEAGGVANPLGVYGFNPQQFVAMTEAVNNAYSTYAGAYNANASAAAAWNEFAAGTGATGAGFPQAQQQQHEQPQHQHQQHQFFGSSTHQAARPSKDDEVPCSTLFIGNLSSNTSDTELRGLFSQCAGFVGLRLSRGKDGLVAFADFENTILSTQAMNQCQSYVLPSSADRGGIRISYAKQRMSNRNQPTSSTAPTHVQ